MELDLGMGRTAVERSRPTTPGDHPNGWALSVSSPWDNQTFTDVAGRIHFVGLAKMTMIPTLTGDGSRITYADPWLPNDDSYEIGGPLGRRFQADSLSAAGSTTFVMNKYGDMYTRTFDFDSSGSGLDLLPIQLGRSVGQAQRTQPRGRNTRPQAPPRSDFRPQTGCNQPKIPGEGHSRDQCALTRSRPNRRELACRGSPRRRIRLLAQGSRRGCLGVHADPARSLLGTLIENAPTDRSTDTLSPAAPWHLSTTLPARDGAIDGQTLIDIGFRTLWWIRACSTRSASTHNRPDYRLDVDHFDPVATRGPRP